MELKKGYKQTEIGVIPEDWDIKELGEIGSFKNGINKPKEDFGFGFPFVNLLDVFGKPKIFGNEDFDLINSTDSDRNLYSLRKGDILFIRSSVKPSGVGLTSVIDVDLEETVFSGFLIRFREIIGIDDEFKKHCFYDQRFRNQLISSSSVSANTNINQDSLRSLKFILPPLPEQRAIAQVLSDTDALIQRMEKKLAKKRAIKEGAMQRLLTPGEGWEERKLGECLNGNPTYGINAAAVSYNMNLPTYLRITDIDDNGRFIKDKKASVKDDNSKYYYLKEGDIVIARTGASVGKSYLYNLSDGELVFAGFLIKVSPDILILNPKYLKYFLQSTIYWDWISVMSMRSGQPGVNGKELSELLIPLPNLQEQTRIATILSDMDAEIAQVEEQLAKYRRVKTGMMQELLTGKTRLV